MEEHSNDDDMLALPPSTLAALASFLDEQSAVQEALADLTAGLYDFEGSKSQSHQENEESSLEANTVGESTFPKSDKYVVSLKEFKRIFKENWQLSQFWYTEDTADQLVKAISKLSNPTSRIAFVCCPTAYVAYKEKASRSSQRLRLLEYDSRFALFALEDFVNYDLDEPLSFPSTFQDELRHSQDIAIVDPPFHARASQEKLAITVRHILDPEDGVVVLLTGTSLAPLLDDVYQGLPKLVRKSIVIKHDGLETPYGCWVGQNDEDRDSSGFGSASE